MDAALFQEGIEYAERNLLSPNGHSYLDKVLIRENFDLRGKEVLDFGCGMGFNSVWFANDLGARVDAVDLDENHIEVARELYRRHGRGQVDFSTRNIITEPIDKQYDFIMLNDVIEHITLEYIEGVLDVLIRRNLKEGGVIFFSYPPWEGPQASHLQRAIPIPWVQFLPHKLVIRMLKKRNQKMVGRNDLLHEYLELNHMTHRKLMSYLKKYPLQLLFRKSHSKLNRFRALRNLNLNFFLFKYIVTKELIAFKKLAEVPAGQARITKPVAADEAAV